MNALTAGAQPDLDSHGKHSAGSLNKQSALPFANDFGYTLWRATPSTTRLPSDTNGSNRSLTSKTQVPHGTNGNQFGLLTSA